MIKAVVLQFVVFYACLGCGRIVHHACTNGKKVSLLTSSLIRSRSITHEFQTNPLNWNDRYNNNWKVLSAIIDNETNKENHSELTSEKSEGDPVKDLLSKYKHRVLVVKSPICDSHEIYLCGTIHIAQKSIDMVNDTMNAVKPHCIMVEMCEDRIDALLECDHEHANISLVCILSNAIRQRSVKTLGLGFLTWLQVTAASFVGSKLGGEIVFAAKEAHRLGAWLVLGDRKYSVTIQRAFDHMPMREKIKIGFFLLIEMMMLSWTKVKDYLIKTHENEDFIADELEHFSKSFPSFSAVIIKERDEYLAQSILEISRYMQQKDSVGNFDLSSTTKKIVAVVGNGHLRGIKSILEQGGVSLERLHKISSSSKHGSSTWPGRGRFVMVNTDLLFGNKSIDSGQSPS